MRLTYITNTILLVILAGCLVVPKLFGVGACLLMLMSLVWILKQRQTIALTIEQKIICFSLCVFGCVSLFSLLLADQSYWTSKRLDHPLRFLFSVPLFIFFSRLQINSKILFWGSALGAICACGQGYYEAYILRNQHTSGQAGHHILFGDISVLLSMLTLTLTPEQSKLRYKLFGLFAFVAGVIAAVCANSRGSWLGLLGLLAVFYFQWRSVFHWKLQLGLFIIISSIFSFAYQQQALNIPQRMQAVIDEFKQYYQTSSLFTNPHSDRQVFNSSVGGRLEMWKAATLLFADSPLAGQGPRTFFPESQVLIGAGKVRDFQGYKHAHNQFFNTLASTGVIGLMGLMGLFFVPLMIFWKMRCASCSQERAFARVGLMICIGYLIFSLTETMFDRQLSIMFYLILVSLCLSQLKSFQWLLLQEALQRLKLQAQLKLGSLLVLCVFSLFFFLTLFFRPIHIEAAGLSEQAYWFAQEGQLKSVFLAEMPSYEQYLLVPYKFFIGLGAFLIKGWGYSIWLLRGIGLLGFFGCLVMMAGFAKILARCDHCHSFSTGTLWLMMLVLMLSSALMAEYAFIFRPETWLMLLGLGVFFCLHQVLEQSGRFWIGSAGFLAGLSTLFHVYGWVFVGAGAVLLLLNGRARQMIFFVLSVVCVFSFYAYVALQEQFWLLLEGNIFELASEHKRYFRTGMSVSWVLFLLVLFGLGYKAGLKISIIKHLGIFTLTAGICLALISPIKIEQYLLLWPLSVCFVVALLSVLLQEKYLRKPLVVLFLFYFVGQSYAFLELWRNYNPLGGELAAIERLTHHQLKFTQAQRIVAPIQVLAHLPPSETFRSHKVLESLLVQNRMKPEQLTEVIPQKSIVILDQSFVQRYGQDLKKYLGEGIAVASVVDYQVFIKR